MTGEPPRLVALLLDGRAATAAAIQRASDLSEAIDAQLSVVLGMPRRAATTHPDLLVAYVIEMLRARAPRRSFELHVVCASIAEVGAEIARDLAADLAVVDAGLGASEACRLVDDLGAPVLVARDERPEGTWIAASDMAYFGFPVLSVARDLARVLDRELVYFHNAAPVSVMASDPMAGAGSLTEVLKLQDDDAEAKRARLEQFAHADRRARGLVTRAGSTVGALLDLAADRDADVLVVGHHPRSWLWRLMGRGTAERVVKRSRRSVLVVPLEDWV